MTRLLINLLLALLVCGCLEPGSPEPAGKAPDDHYLPTIKGGSLDTETTGVVAISGPHGALCSGALIASNVVMTARHCVAVISDGGQGVDCDETIASAPALPSAFTVHTVTEVSTADPGQAAEGSWSVAAVEVPPGNAFLCGTDVALLLLDEHIPASVAAPLAPRLEPAPIAGERYHAVGYGADDPNGGGDGVRRRLDDLEIVCAGVDCAGATSFGEHVHSVEWVGNGGVCKGDSGGPALDEQGRIIGVTSRGADDCTLAVYTDTTHYADWIATHVATALDESGGEPPPWLVATGLADMHVPSSGCTIHPTRAAAFACDHRAARWGLLSLAIALLLITARRRRTM